MRMEREYDLLVVGAGLFGATYACMAHRQGKKCLVIDKRPHLGGNIYCEQREGINVHKYGAHIFHTSNKQVWEFVNSFVPFNRYTNSPLANYKGKLYNLPFNMNTFHQMWGITSPAEAAAIIEEQREKARLQMISHKGNDTPENLEEQALLLIGSDIYERLIKEYTEKQWGRKCTELPAFIIKRLPVRLVYDNNYFNDLHQGIPTGGYNRLIDGLLAGIETRTGADFFGDRNHWEGMADKIVFTGKIDEYFDYRFGKLEYRTVRFEEETLPVANYQGNAVVNYTEYEVPYTRIIEHKHFEFGTQEKTVITKEYPATWQQGDEPYYPMNDEENTALFAKYRALADKEDRVIFGGRLGEYKYYDMHQVIRRALEVTRGLST